MTFQIESVILYGEGELVRPLPFTLGELNIITGNSRTGKSSVLHIVDYCLGSNGYPVPAGVIRQSVRIYAVVLATPVGRTMIARPAPRAGASVSTQIHLRFLGPKDNIPPADQLDPNTDHQALRRFLSELVGIAENVHIPESGTRQPLSAGLRQALFFNFQAQDEIASPSTLFHSQGEEWRPQAIRDVIPYFIGAVDSEYIRKQERLRSLIRERKLLTRNRDESAAVVRPSGRALGLLQEARTNGLLDASFQLPEPTESSISAALRVALESQLIAPPVSNQDEQYSLLLAERATTRAAVSSLRARVQNLATFRQEQAGFDQEAAEQAARLSSLNLIRQTNATAPAQCPICEQDLSAAVPAVGEMRAHLASLSEEIGVVRRDTPRVEALIATLVDEISQQEESLAENQRQLSEIQSSRDAYAAYENQVVRQAAVRGRISLYLDSRDELAAADAVGGRIEDIDEEIERLETDLDRQAAERRLDSSMSRINRRITEIASELGLQDETVPARLDIKNLTVIVDGDDGPVPLSEIGSGENWVGYHLAVFLALHEWFTENSRPVPRFLMIDQPSQVYFPPDATSSKRDLDDSDRQGLTRMYSAILNTVRRLAPNLQIIVIDHADLDVDWFRNARVEVWRQGEALVPAGWPRVVGR